MSVPVLSVIVIIYLLMIAFLGWKGYQHTKTASDFMLAGRDVNPYIMALSYGATFISTSAIIGFGGAAGLFGLGLLWLTFLNIFVGIFIAFVFIGKKTRRMGHVLQAHTFPELLGRRYKSKFVQIFSGIIILTMVLYAAVVLIGAGRYLEEIFHMNFDVALLLLSVIITAYVIAGGLRGVMYTDALQGSIMFIGMAILLVFTFVKLGGVTEAHKKLDGLFDKSFKGAVVSLQSSYNANLEEGEKKLSFKEAEAIAPFFGAVLWQGKGKAKDVKKKIAGKNFKACLTKTKIDLSKKFGKMIGTMKKKYGKNLGNLAALSKFKALGHQGWAKMPKSRTPFWWLLVSTIIMGVGIGVLAQPQLAVRFMTVKSDRELNRAVLIGGVFIFMMTGVAFIVGSLSNVFFYEVAEGTKGAISIIAAGGNKDKIMPKFFKLALPMWFNYILMLSLLSAAMSTLSSQFHAMGTAISRDIFEASGFIKDADSKKSMITAKLGIGSMLIVVVILGYILPKGYIAAGTALFFGLTATAFLPAFLGGLYWKRATKEGAIASILAGFTVSAFWLIFVHFFTVSKWGAKSILGKSELAFVDPLFIALPISILVFIIVSLLTKPLDKEHIDKCFTK